MTDKLTKASAHDAYRERTQPGQASWASDPHHICFQCQHFGEGRVTPVRRSNERAGCGKYAQMTGHRETVAFSGTSMACRYFKKKAEAR